MPPLAESSFADGPAALLWDALVEQYAEDPGLRAAGVTIQAWSGHAEDLAEISAESLPALRITPDSSQLAWTDEQRLEGSWRIRFDYAVAGSRVRDLMNFSDAIRMAFLCNTATLAAFIPLGCFGWNISETGWKPAIVGCAQGISSTSILTLKLNVQAS